MGTTNARETLSQWAVVITGKKKLPHQVVAVFPVRQFFVQFFVALLPLLFVCIYIETICIYVTANLRKQLFPGIPNPFREFGEYLK